MKKIAVLFLMLFICGFVIAQKPKTIPKSTGNTSQSKTKKQVLPMDTIIMLSGVRMVVRVSKVNEGNVAYVVPGKKGSITVDNKTIQKVVFGTGKVVEVNTPVVKVEPEKKEEKLDTIVKMGGKKLIAKVIRINANDVTYTLPGKGDMLSMLRKDIEKVIFQNGRLEVFNKPVLMMIDETQWEAVGVTENPAEVEGLYPRGKISATSSSDCRDKKSAKKSATIRLQKKAANMKAAMILVTKSQAKGGYGEDPGYDMEGTAYGLEPLPNTPPDSGKKAK